MKILRLFRRAGFRDVWERQDKSGHLLIRFRRAGFRDVRERALKKREDIHIRVSAMMNGNNGAPIRRPTRTLQRVMTIACEDELKTFLKENATPIPYCGAYTIGLWKSRCGEYVVKKTACDDQGYMPYAQVALLHPENPLMPRIDAIIEARTGVYVVMEPLVRLAELPRKEREELVRAALYDFNILRLSVDRKPYAYSGLMARIVRDMPKESVEWTVLTGKIIEKTEAELDLAERNIMFRRNDDGTFAPVIIDPLACGRAYDRLSPRYRDRRVSGEEFTWDIELGPPAQSVLGRRSSDAPNP